jgi:hypothetical protein
MSREERLDQRTDKRGVAAEGGFDRMFRRAQKALLVGFHGAEEVFGNGLASDGGASQAKTGSHSETENHVACDGTCVGEIVRRACSGASEKTAFRQRSRQEDGHCGA